MAATIKGGVQPAFGFIQTPATGFLSGVPLPINLAVGVNYGNGTTVDNADLVAVKTFTFVASTPQTIDLTAMTDVQGNAVAFAKVVLVAVRMEGTADASTLTLSPNGTSGWAALTSANLILHAATTANPNGSFLLMATPALTGWAVDSTHKALDFTPSAHAFTATLVVVGRSA
jgi:hypothetical protein